jgi:MFS family permease
VRPTSRLLLIIENMWQLGWLQTAFDYQWSVVKELHASPVLFIPMLVVWVATAGGALHASVTVFYYLELGDEKDVGLLGAISTVGSLVCAPVYGMLLDSGKPFHAMLAACTVCAIGCLVRGLAPSVAYLYVGVVIMGLGASAMGTTVLSFVTQQTAKKRRPAMISGFVAQTTALGMLAKLCFPPLDWFVEHVLGVENKLMRYRVHMSFCSIACVFGVVAYLKIREKVTQRAKTGNGLTAVSLDDIEGDAATREGEGEGEEVREEGTPRGQAVAPLMGRDSDDYMDDATLDMGRKDHMTDGRGQTSGAQTSTLTLIKSLTGRMYVFIAILLVQAMCMTTAKVLWPFFLRDHFQYGPGEYALMLFVVDALRLVVLGCVPVAEQRLGQLAVGKLACAVAAVCGLGSFMCSDVSVLLHLALYSVFISAVAMLEPTLKSLCSVSMPACKLHSCVYVHTCAHQSPCLIFFSNSSNLVPLVHTHIHTDFVGRIFGFVSTAMNLGTITGNLLGTNLYMLDSEDAAAGSGIIMPFVILGTMLSASALALHAIADNGNSGEKREVEK